MQEETAHPFTNAPFDQKAGTHNTPSCDGVNTLDDGINRELRSRIGKAEYAQRDTDNQGGHKNDSSEACGGARGILESVLKIEPRPLGDLLDAVVGAFQRYIVFPLREQASVIALWVAHTWAFRAFDYTPYLFITAASKRSGKSRVLEVAELLVKNGKKTESGSSAALVRSIEQENPPTFLLDEVDKLYTGRKGGDGEADNTCRFLNAGYRRGAKFLRCVGQGASIEPKELPAFCPKALAGIGRCLPDTVADRSITIELARQTRDRRAERLRDREARAALAPLKNELQAWAEKPGVKEALEAARPVIPGELHDRAQDICEPLLAIADLAGGEWPEITRSALVKLYAGEEDADTGVELLKAIKALFDEKQADKLPTKDIIEWLVGLEDGPWASWFEDALKHDKLKTAGSKLARLLKRYRNDGVEHCKVRAGGETAWGYTRDCFRKAWERYLGPSTPSHRKHGTDGTQAQFTSEKPCSMQNASTWNVPCTAVLDGTQKHEGKTPNVPCVPCNQDEGQNTPPAALSQGALETPVDSEFEKDFQAHLDELAADGYSPSDIEAQREWFRFFQDSKWVQFDWIRLYPDEGHPDWIPVVREALAKPCEVCGESLADELWLHYQTDAVQCPECRATGFWDDGYEIDQWGNPSCWDSRYTRGQRIAERDLAILERATKDWKESDEGRAALEAARRECLRLGVRPELYAQLLGVKHEPGMTPGQFLAEATALFSATPAAS